MHKANRWIFLTLCGLSLVGSARATSEAVRIEEIKLQRTEAKNVLTMVRTLAGTTRVQIADERTLRIESTPDKVRLARKVIELTEGAQAAAESGVQYEVGDGSIVACVALRHASGDAVMAGLRTLSIRRIAVVREPLTALVRGNAEQVKAALAKIRDLDREPPKAPLAPKVPVAPKAPNTPNTATPLNTPITLFSPVSPASPASQ